MDLVGWSLRQRVLVNLLFLLLLLIGIVVYRSLPVDSWPEVSLDEAWINTYWGGAGAEEVERLVTREIEEEIQDVSGVDRIVSNSQSEISFIDVKFDEDLDETALETAFNDLRTALDRVTDLPPDAEVPILRRLTTSEVWPLFSVVVSTADPALPEIVLRECARELRKRLVEVEGVRRIRYQSFRDRELDVSVDRLAARRYGVGLAEILAALGRTNRAWPAGSLSSPVRPGSRDVEEVRVTYDTEFGSPEEIGDAVVRVRPGREPIRVRDVAQVVAGFEKARVASRINGQKALVLNVAKNEASDTLRLRDECWRVMRDYSAEVPDPIRFEIVGDQSEVVRSRFGILIQNLLQGMVLVSLILFFALGLRNALIALVGIPFSYLCGFILFPALGMSINNLTLFGMVLVGGMLVDDAIIVIENIYRHVEKGTDLRSAVKRGAREVAWPVLNACSTTIAAMSPLLLQGGVVGKFFAFIPKVVILALSFSVLQCITVLPVHYLEFGARLREEGPGRFERWRSAIFGAGVRLYTRVLRRVLQFRVAFLALVGGSSILLVGLVLQIRQDPWISDFNAVFASIRADPTYALKQTGEACRLFEEACAQMRREGLLKSYYLITGFRMTPDGIFITRPDAALVLATLSDRPEVTSAPEKIVQRLRAEFDRRISSQHRYRFEGWEVFTPHDGPPLGKPVAVRVESNDYHQAKRVAEELKAELRRMGGVFGVADNLDLGPRELRFVVDEDRAAARGLYPDDVALVLRAANDGITAGSYKDRELDENVDLRVRYAARDRRSVADLQRAGVSLADGSLVPLGEISRVRVSRPNANFYHYDAHRTVLVTADVDGTVATGPGVNRRLEAMFADVPQRYPGVRLVFGGEFEETQKSMAQQRRSFWIALVLIYVLLATQFRSYTQPLIVMAVVPFGVLGVLLGLWVRDQPFTIPTFIAMIGLAGVVVNDSLVLVEFINLRRREGADRLQAVLQGAAERFRPVLLTAGTTIGNLVPLAFGLGGVSRVWTPFAVSIVFGMGVASLMTLFMVPVLYSLVARKGPPAEAS